MENQVIWAETQQQLKRISDQLKQLNDKLTVISVDLQYFGFTNSVTISSVFQLSTQYKDYVIDALTLRRLIKQYLGWVFQSKDIVKILHGCDSDLQLLMTDMDIICVNFFDTAKAYVHALQKCEKQKGSKIYKSLQFLVQTFLGVKLDKSFQIADWRIRPLPKAMLQYARCDTHYLIDLFLILRALILGDEEVIDGCSQNEKLNAFRQLKDKGGKELLKDLALVCNKMAIDRFTKNNLIRAHVWVKGRM